jgi:uncharacterized protein with HEPN domain
VTDDRTFLQHILQAIDRIAQYTSEGEAAFLDDTMIQDAVIRNLEVIGEAVKNLSSETSSLHDDIPWRRMAGMRDRVIHGYFHVNLRLVWNVVETDLPRLRNRIKVMKES